MAQEPKVIPGGSPKKARKRGLMKLLHQLKKDYIPRMKKYEEAEKIFAGRNSYSKTDPDATFMHMKEVHMNNGQLKPSYNIQAAITDQYVVDLALYSNPTDFKTLEPFLKQMTTLENLTRLSSMQVMAVNITTHCWKTSIQIKSTTFLILYTKRNKLGNIRMIRLNWLPGSMMKKTITILIKMALNSISNIIASARTARLVKYVI